MSEADFVWLAEDTLAELRNAIISYDDRLEATLDKSVLAIRRDAAAGDINIQSRCRPRQLWLEHQGQSWRFDYDELREAWVQRRSGWELRAKVRDLLHRPRSAN